MPGTKLHALSLRFESSVLENTFRAQAFHQLLILQLLVVAVACPSALCLMTADSNSEAQPTINVTATVLAVLILYRIWAHYLQDQLRAHVLTSYAVCIASLGFVAFVWTLERSTLSKFSRHAAQRAPQASFVAAMAYPIVLHIFLLPAMLRWPLLLTTMTATVLLQCFIFGCDIRPAVQLVWASACGSALGHAFEWGLRSSCSQFARINLNTTVRSFEEQLADLVAQRQGQPILVELGKQTVFLHAVESPVSDRPTPRTSPAVLKMGARRSIRRSSSSSSSTPEDNPAPLHERSGRSGQSVTFEHSTDESRDPSFSSSANSEANASDRVLSPKRRAVRRAYKEVRRTLLQKEETFLYLHGREMRVTDAAYQESLELQKRYQILRASLRSMDQA